MKKTLADTSQKYIYQIINQHTKRVQNHQLPGKRKLKPQGDTTTNEPEELQFTIPMIGEEVMQGEHPQTARAHGIKNSHSVGLREANGRRVLSMHKALGLISSPAPLPQKATLNICLAVDLLQQNKCLCLPHTTQEYLWQRCW